MRLTFLSNDACLTNFRWLLFLKNTLIAHIFFISALIFVIFASLLWSDSQSLIAHDEGLYARRAKLILDSGDWLSPFSSPHHKTVGSYWAIAISLKLFESVIGLLGCQAL